MNYAKCATCHGLNSMGFCQYTACRYPETESGVINGSVYVAKIVTNADRIRAMTDEELDKFLGEVQWDVANYCGGVTQKQEYPVPEHMGAWLDWLRQEA